MRNRSMTGDPIPMEFFDEIMALNEIRSGTNLDAIEDVSYNNRCNEKKGKTMANIINKKQLRFTNGYLELGGTLVAPSFLKDYMELEDFLQQARYKNELDKEFLVFHRESMTEGTLIKIEDPATPTMDKEAKKVDKISKEAMALVAAGEARNVLDQFNSVCEFVMQDSVVLYDENYRASLIDTPMLGNPLELTEEKLVDLVCEAVEYKRD